MSANTSSWPLTMRNCRRLREDEMPECITVRWRPSHRAPKRSSSTPCVFTFGSGINEEMVTKKTSSAQVGSSQDESGQDQVRSAQVGSDRTKSGQIRSNQVKSAHLRSSAQMSCCRKALQYCASTSEGEASASTSGCGNA